jgi:hypothetical protein
MLPVRIRAGRPQVVRTHSTRRRQHMAKGQNRGNREPKKPKSKKAPAAAEASILSPKNMAARKALPQKKA